MAQNKKDLDKNEHPRDSTYPTDEEKPLKKARYVWEVKGKQHLKSGSSKMDLVDVCSTSKRLNTDSQHEEGRSGEEEGKSDNEQQDNVTCSRIQDNVVENQEPDSSADGFRRCCFSEIIDRSSDVIDRAMNSVLTENYNPDEGRSLNETEQNDNFSPNTDNLSTSRESKEEGYEDYMILKWQARQIARGYVDNTINTMLETEMYERPAVPPRRIVDLPPAGGVERLFSSDVPAPELNVEHEAIFEAIKTHGLQSKDESVEGGSSQGITLHKSTESDSCRSYELEKPSSTLIVDPSTSISSSHGCSTTASISSPRRSTTATIPSSTRSTPPTSTENIESTETIELENVCPSFSCDLVTDPMDFLNAAVSVAIQKKGLTCG